MGQGRAGADFLLSDSSSRIQCHTDHAENNAGSVPETDQKPNRCHTNRARDQNFEEPSRDQIQPRTDTGSAWIHSCVNRTMTAFIGRTDSRQPFNQKQRFQISGFNSPFERPSCKDARSPKLMKNKPCISGLPEHHQADLFDLMRRVTGRPIPETQIHPYR